MGAIREALDLELAADPDVFVMGEDVGRVGGLFRATEGLYERYGAERIRDTPLTESGFVGCGIGAALTGLRPVVELQFSDFAGVAFDQIMNQAAKLRFMMGGTPSMPLVLRMASGGGLRLGAQHSQSLEALFSHIPGLVVAMPSNPYDAKGLLAAAIQDDNPVIFLEQKLSSSATRCLCPRSVTRSSSAKRVSSERAATSRSWRSARWSRTPSGSRASSSAKASTSRSSTRARSSRSTPTRSRRRSRRRAASSSSTRRPVRRLRRRGRGLHRRALLLGPRCAGRPRIGAPSHPMPYQKDLEPATLPGPARIAAAVRSLVRTES